ncbi:uncharacterized protein EHS24_006162 [Apiotrichum porosum]|uniref:Uncharacterized protein n=1 Tax=Apiotrichum porosum TaxID=105984 RepID=A0A427Y0K7_9TREE|nr:uncharacterized protein EHS24_006162 [Apiotrichum porosum]RSH84638.1 hypothetical protein EHS24_006162 [Apiotrichum porosum]
MKFLAVTLATIAVVAAAPISPTAQAVLGACSTQCDMSAFAYTNTSDTRQQLCSAEGRAKMDECARCIDDTWSFSTYEESARFEYKAVLAACDLPDDDDI